jgi:hypothetical protein
MWNMTPPPQKEHGDQRDRTLKWEPHWLTPPELYKKLDDEFHFNYDPCPFPKPKDYNGIDVEWGTSNYVNPPFHPENGIGPTAFVRKAIQENKKGKTVVLTIPTQSYVNLLLEAGAELRSLGRVKWLHTVTREPMKGPSPITAFILRSRPTPSTEPCCISCKNIPCKPLNRVPCVHHPENPCDDNGCTDIDNCDEICEHSPIYSPTWVKKHDAAITAKAREDVLKLSQEMYGVMKCIRKKNTVEFMDYFSAKMGEFSRRYNSLRTTTSTKGGEQG